jgi:peptidoglycan hydrolase-like protein with peptidoglycan-binding domain
MEYYSEENGAAEVEALGLGDGYYYKRTLGLGSEGRGVSYLQDIVGKFAARYSCVPAVKEDGVFGEKTRRAVMDLQGLLGIKQDGVVGPVTWEAIDKALYGKPAGEPALAIGVSGDKVRRLQESLNALAIRGGRIRPVKVDGIFGWRTEQSLKDFQSAFGLKADGMAGVKTWAAIEGALSAGAKPSPEQPAGRITKPVERKPSSPRAQAPRTGYNSGVVQAVLIKLLLGM